MTEDKRTGGIEDLGPLPKWTQQESDDFTHARDLVGAVVAEYSARIGETTERETVEQLRSQQRKYFQEMQRLSVRDKEEVRRILSEYPGILRKIREGDA